jgi:hypothetical protein
MSSNSITPAPVLNRNSSDDEILKLTTHLPRRNGGREANGGGRDTPAQISEPRTDEQLEIDFGTNEVSKGTRRRCSAFLATSWWTGQRPKSHSCRRRSRS